jgi:hypothetical protein
VDDENGYGGVGNDDALKSPSSSHSSKDTAGDPKVISSLANSTSRGEIFTRVENVTEEGFDKIVPSDVAPSSTHHVCDIFTDWEKKRGTISANRQRDTDSVIGLECSPTSVKPRRGKRSNAKTAPPDRGRPSSKVRIREVEAVKSSKPSGMIKKKKMGHAYARHHRDQAWEVEDLNDVNVATDGSIQCMVRWKPTEVRMNKLIGAALHNRCELLFKRKYGNEAWEKLRMM